MDQNSGCRIIDISIDPQYYESLISDIEQLDSGLEKHYPVSHENLIEKPDIPDKYVIEMKFKNSCNINSLTQVFKKYSVRILEQHIKKNIE